MSSTAGSSATSVRNARYVRLIARRTRREHLLHERHVEQRLVGTRDSDGHGLRLVLDRVDRPRQLLDRLRERGHEVLDDGARRADLAEARPGTRRAARPRSRTATATRAEPPSPPRASRRSSRCAARRRTAPSAASSSSTQRVERIGAGAARLRAGFDAAARFAERARRRVDRERGLVAEEVAGHRAEHEAQDRGARPARRSSRSPPRIAPRRRRRSRSARPCGRGRSPAPWRRRRRSSRAAPPRTRGSSARPTSRCASCPR